ncbi:hypothetical protein GGI11_008585, partial [Coemansia sp. RSA 2049]
RLSTAEILKQVTAAVDNLGFDDFEICDLDTFDDPSAPKPSAPPIPSANGADSKQNPYQSPQNSFSPHTPPVALQPTASDQEKPSALERKTVTHKKSGSWWQWGRDDSASAASGSGGSNSAAGGEKDIRPSVSLPGTTPWQRQQQPPLPQSQQEQQQQHPQLHKAATIAALNPHAAANGPANMTHTDTISAASPPSASTPSTSSSSSLLKSKLPSPISFLRFNRKSKKERQAADEQQQQQQQTGSGQLRASSNASKSLQAKQQTMSLGLGAGSNKQQGPSSAVGAAVALSTGNSNANAGAQKSNIPSIITPVRPPPTRLTTGNNRLPIHIERAIYRLASIKLANPRRPLLQQVLLSNMMFWYLELINPRSQQQHQQQHRAPSPEVGGMNGHYGSGGGGDKRGKRGHKNRDQANRRRSAGSASSERVVMRSPQYERQQQQIYMYP